MTWILLNKRISLIIALFLCLLFSLGYANHLKGELLKADQKQAEAVEKAVKPYIDAAKTQQDELNKASQDYEATKNEERIRTEIVTREVQKIIDRPVYLNECFDVDGVSAINRLIPDNST